MPYIVKYLKFFIIYTIFSNQFVNADNVTDTNTSADISETSTDANIPDTSTNDKAVANSEPVSQTTTESEITTELSGNCTLADTLPRKTNYADTQDWTNLRNVTAVFNYMQTLARSYPKQARLHEVGTSQGGSPIYALEVVYSVYTGATVVIDAGMTGTDQVAVNFALFVLHNLLELLSSNISTLTGVKFIVIPLVNPDEYTRSFSGMQSQTCREPFYSNFDIGDPPQHSLCGSAKFLTEREVKDLASYYSNIRDFKLYLNTHSGTGKIGFPFGYKKEIAENVVIEMADNMRNVIDSKLVPKKATMSSLNTMFGDHPGAAVDWVYEKLAVPYSFYISLDADENDRMRIFRAYYDALRYGVLQIQLTDPNVAKAIYRDCSGNEKIHPNNILILYISLITMSLKIINF